MSKNPSTSVLSLVRAVWRLFDRSMRIKVIGLVALMLAIGVIEGVGIGLIIPLFQLIESPTAIDKATWLAQLHHWAGRPDHKTFVMILFGGFFALIVVKNVIVLLSVYVQTRFVWRSSATVAAELFHGYLLMPYEFFLKRDSTHLMRNITNSVAQIFQGAVTPAIGVVTETIVALSVAIVLFAVAPMPALTVSLMLALPTAALLFAVKRTLWAWGLVGHDLVHRNLRALNESFGAVKEIKVLGREVPIAKNYGKIPFALAAVNEKYTVVQGLPRLVLEVLVVGAMVIVGAMVLDGSDSPGTLLGVLGVFAAAAFRLMPSANRIANYINVMNLANAAVSEIVDDLAAIRAARADQPGDAPPVHLTRQLSLDHVSFAYESAPVPVLRDVTIDIPSGQSVAFVGPSGAGKTTLVNLLLGLLQPTEGRITVDGKVIDTNARAWRDCVGFVPQDTFLLDDTVRRNIALGVPDAEIDDDAVWSALASAQLTEFVESAPNKLDAMVGERGTRISGGQKQRISIARALYTNPDILIMDEATSSLDAETEALISAAIDALRGDKTLIIVAHRLSTVKNCDRIFWMKEGRISDSGSFVELTRRNADFRSLVEHHDLTDALGLMDRNGERSAV